MTTTTPTPTTWADALATAIEQITAAQKWEKAAGLVVCSSADYLCRDKECPSGHGEPHKENEHCSDPCEFCRTDCVKRMCITYFDHRLAPLRQLLNFAEEAFGDVRARYERMDGALKHLASMTNRLAAYWTSVAQKELQQLRLSDVADAVRQYVESAALPDNLLAGNDLADLIQADDLAGFQAAVAEVLK